MIIDRPNTTLPGLACSLLLSVAILSRAYPPLTITDVKSITPLLPNPMPGLTVNNHPNAIFWWTFAQYPLAKLLEVLWHLDPTSFPTGRSKNYIAFLPISSDEDLFLVHRTLFWSNWLLPLANERGTFSLFGYPNWRWYFPAYDTLSAYRATSRWDSEALL